MSDFMRALKMGGTKWEYTEGFDAAEMCNQDGGHFQMMVGDQFFDICVEREFIKNTYESVITLASDDVINVIFDKKMEIDGFSIYLNGKEQMKYRTQPQIVDEGCTVEIKFAHRVFLSVSYG